MAKTYVLSISKVSQIARNQISKRYFFIYYFFLRAQLCCGKDTLPMDQWRLVRETIFPSGPKNVFGVWVQTCQDWSMTWPRVHPQTNTFPEAMLWRWGEFPSGYNGHFLPSFPSFHAVKLYSCGCVNLPVFQVLTQESANTPCFLLFWPSPLCSYPGMLSQTPWSFSLPFLNLTAPPTTLCLLTKRMEFSVCLSSSYPSKFTACLPWGISLKLQ